MRLGRYWLYLWVQSGGGGISIETNFFNLAGCTVKYGLLIWPIVVHVLTKRYNQTVNSEWAKKRCFFSNCKPGKFKKKKAETCLENEVVSWASLILLLHQERTGRAVLLCLCWHELVEKVPGNSTFYYNPLHRNISKDILHTVLYTFPMLLTRRICLTTKSFSSWWSF